jgi:hypothetical protein
MFLEIEVWKVMAEPRDGLFEPKIVQVHRQINGAAAHALIPVRKLGRSAGDHALCSMPFGFVIAIAFRSGQQEHFLQRDGPDPIGALSNLLESHGS